MAVLMRLVSDLRAASAVRLIRCRYLSILSRMMNVFTFRNILDVHAPIPWILFDHVRVPDELIVFPPFSDINAKDIDVNDMFDRSVSSS